MFSNSSQCLHNHGSRRFLGLELQKRQSAAQNVDVLPTLSIADIDKKVVRIPIIQGQIGRYDISMKSMIY